MSSKKNKELKEYKYELVKDANDIKELKEYLDLVRATKAGLLKYPICEDQVKLADYVERKFKEEKLYTSYEQIKDYMGLQKYFSYDLFEWEKYVFVLHNCIFTEDNLVRWPTLFLYMGRGGGKNGYDSFESFALISPYNPIKKYHITICANSEDQATTSFDDVYDVLEENESKLSKWFSWNKETIRCKVTGSEFSYATSNPNTKDGGRQGAIIFDELHQYENYKIINVFTSGLGKKKHPRRTYSTTNGYVREGPLDDMIKDGEDILNGVVDDDNGMLPFMCRLENEDEALDINMMHKANPSLRYRPDLMAQMKIEFKEYVKDKYKHPDYIVKRGNFPRSGNIDLEVTSWENILATNKPIPRLEGCECYAGTDYAKTNDFASAGLLFKYGDDYVWITHSWVYRGSADWDRIQPDLEEWEQRGLLTIVDNRTHKEIEPELIADWFYEQSMHYNITRMYCDDFRWTWLKRALSDVGFDTAKGGRNNVTLIRISNKIKVQPVICSLFNNHHIIYGDNPLMRWFTNNTCLHDEKHNNFSFQKIEPKSRKTDGFFAFIAAMCGVIEKDLQDSKDSGNNLDLLKVYSY